MIKTLTAILICLFMVAPAMADNDAWEDMMAEKDHIKEDVETCEVFAEQAATIMWLRNAGLSSAQIIEVYRKTISEQMSEGADINRLMDRIVKYVIAAQNVPIHDKQEDRIIAIRQFKNMVFTSCFKEISEMRNELEKLEADK